MPRTAAEFGVPFCVFFAYFVHLSRGLHSNDYVQLTLCALFSFAVVFSAWFVAAFLMEMKPRRGRAKERSVATVIPTPHNHISDSLLVS